MARVQAIGLGKSYGSTPALTDLSFEVVPGRVTALLGPNGSGKSTAMRLMLGLDRGAGETLFDGVPYERLDSPGTRVGAMLSARAAHPGRSAGNHLTMVAAGLGIERSRCGSVLEQVELSGAANRRLGTFSMGMVQRLCLAAALLGSPDTLMLDEPGNGLDPQGMAWLRGFLVDYAARGNALLLSSHLLSDLQDYVEDVVVIGHGRHLASGPLESFLETHEGAEVVVRTDANAALGRELAPYATSCWERDGRTHVRGMSLEDVGRLAHRCDATVFELRQVTPSLERAYLSVLEAGRADAPRLEEAR